MSNSDTAPNAGFLARRWRLLSAGLALVAVTSGTAGWVVSPQHPAVRNEPRSEPSYATAPAASTQARAGAHPSQPVGLEIPAIEVSAPVVLLGLNKDETVEVPSDPDDVGWYRHGSSPGQAGSAVILGHVDSTAGPAVFYRLKTLKVGAEVRVLRGDGSTARFQVVKIATYPNAQFPARTVYRSHGRRSLTLVTCGGAYYRSRGGYQANVVVYAEFAGITHVAR